MSGLGGVSGEGVEGLLSGGGGLVELLVATEPQSVSEVWTDESHWTRAVVMFNGGGLCLCLFCSCSLGPI